MKNAEQATKISQSRVHSLASFAFFMKTYFGSFSEIMNLRKISIKPQIKSLTPTFLIVSATLVALTITPFAQARNFENQSSTQALNTEIPTSPQNGKRTLSESSERIEPSPFSAAEFFARPLEEWMIIDRESISSGHQEAKRKCRQKYPNNQQRMNDPNCRFETTVKTKWSSELAFQMILKLKNKQHLLEDNDRTANFFSLLKDFYLDKNFICKDQVTWLYFHGLTSGQQTQSENELFKKCAISINMLDDYTWLERAQNQVLETENQDRQPSINEKQSSEERALKQNRVTVKLPVENLESIDLVLVSPGETFRSQWGHVMFRLNFTTPIVNGNEAKSLYFTVYEDPNLKSGLLNFMPGLLGQSQLRAEFWSEGSLTLGYFLQKRILDFYRLGFSKSEKQTFLAFANSMHQNGYGSWQHASQNCTSTAIDLLHASSSKFRNEFLMDLTPAQLIEHLKNIPQIFTEQGRIDLSGEE